MASQTRWWESSVTYPIYPRSYCHTSRNGIGDLAAVTAHLDHLAWFGVDAHSSRESPHRDFHVWRDRATDVVSSNIDIVPGQLAPFDGRIGRR